MMDKFIRVTGAAAPLIRINIDTEVIIPINRLISHKRGELGAYCFEAWRYAPDGSENPEFVINKPRYREAKILVTGDNFGCGSSREHAVWSLADFGFRCVIAPSFGDIFYWNCFQNGVLPIRLPQEQVNDLAAEIEATEQALVTVDLETQSITSPAGRTVTVRDRSRTSRCLIGRSRRYRNDAQTRRADSGASKAGPRDQTLDISTRGNPARATPINLSR